MSRKISSKGINCPKMMHLIIKVIHEFSTEQVVVIQITLHLFWWKTILRFTVFGMMENKNTTGKENELIWEENIFPPSKRHKTFFRPNQNYQYHCHSLTTTATTPAYRHHPNITQPPSCHHHRHQPATMQYPKIQVHKGLALGHTPAFDTHMNSTYSKISSRNK